MGVGGGRGGGAASHCCVSASRCLFTARLRPCRCTNGTRKVVWGVEVGGWLPRRRALYVLLAPSGGQHCPGLGTSAPPIHPRVLSN